MRSKTAVQRIECVKSVDNFRSVLKVGKRTQEKDTYTHAYIVGTFAYETNVDDVNTRIRQLRKPDFGSTPNCLDLI